MDAMIDSEDVWVEIIRGELGECEYKNLLSSFGRESPKSKVSRKQLCSNSVVDHTIRVRTFL